MTVIECNNNSLFFIYIDKNNNYIKMNTVGSHTKIMKQTLNTHACSLAREEAAAYSLTTGKAAAGTRENG